ncbi:Bax inhibitor-1 family protein [Pedobacter sp. UC225_61]|uniref:Bax inhibitor-1 family protein n=1 Tax=Pedobacter sp. UC225_61 TaxID=3374623 RepID=UPI0037901F70
MAEQNYQYQNDSVFVQERSVSKKFFANVFLWMFVALSISTLTAFYISYNPSVISILTTQNPETGKLGPNILGLIAIFAPFGLIMLMNAGMRRFSYGTLAGIFILYSVLTGFFLSFILAIYVLTSIYICFAAAASIFAVMAIMGYTTNVDLSKFGPILSAGIIGLIIISVINMFIGSESLYYFLGFVGVAIFTALTAFQVQAIKRIGEGLDNADDATIEDSKKLALIGALSLYITFLNLFLSLLRIFGSRK